MHRPAGTIGGDGLLTHPGHGHGHGRAPDTEARREILRLEVAGDVGGGKVSVRAKCNSFLLASSVASPSPFPIRAPPISEPQVLRRANPASGFLVLPLFPT